MCNIFEPPIQYRYINSYNSMYDYAILHENSNTNKNSNKNSNKSCFSCTKKDKSIIENNTKYGTYMIERQYNSYCWTSIKNKIKKLKRYFI